MKVQYLQYSTSTSGTVTITDAGTDVQLIHEAALAASLTIAFPATPLDGQQVFISSIGGITLLTLTTPVGSIVNAITTLAVGGISGWIYRGSTTKWYKVM